MKFSFFAAMSKEIQFEYTVVPPMITFNTWGAERLGLKETVMDPTHSDCIRRIMDSEAMAGLSSALRASTPAQPVVRFDCRMRIGEEERWTRIVARATWSSDEPPQLTGAIGKAIDVHDSRMKLDALERMASHDNLTGLLNHASAKERIIARMEDEPGSRFAMAIIDLDHFKSANDNYGHIFGDHVLRYLAAKLCESIRGADIAARVGGDEFLLFLEYRGDARPIISRIFNALSSCSFEGFPISISMGVARTAVVGTDYETLFNAADQALYAVKRAGRGCYRFYDEGMRKMFSAISPIDSADGDGKDNENKGEDAS